MLKQRIITGAVLAGAIVAAILLLPTPWLAAVLGVFIVLAAWEWADLSGLVRWPARSAYVLTLVALAWGVFALLPPLALFAASVGWWLAVTLRLVLGGPASPLPGVKGLWLLAGPLTLLPAYFAVLFLHQLPPGAPFLMYMLVTVWVADIGAYFVGRRWGRHKLAPAISPGKTWEGAAGGLLLVALYGALGGWLFTLPATSWALLALLVVAAGALSICGDLFESLLKRVAQRKDSGRLLPGHGGVLDRIDSVTAAAPVLALGSVTLLPL